jgi:hypothetical protein
LEIAAVVRIVACCCPTIPQGIGRKMLAFFPNTPLPFQHLAAKIVCLPTSKAMGRASQKAFSVAW